MNVDEAVRKMAISPVKLRSANIWEEIKVNRVGETVIKRKRKFNFVNQFIITIIGVIIGIIKAYMVVLCGCFFEEMVEMDGKRGY